MRAAALVGTALLVLACASSRPSASKADVPSPATDAAPVATAGGQEPGGRPIEAAKMAPASAPVRPNLWGNVGRPGGPGGPQLPGAFRPAGGLPLVAPGESRTESEGCLTLAAPETEGPTKAPAVENTRGAFDGPEVAVRQTPGGITVSHGLHHNCCQKAEVKTTVEESKVTVTETFTGNTCRCNCRSTINTTVGLAQGEYSLEVVRVDGGPPKSVYTGSISVHPVAVPVPKPRLP